MTPTDKPMTIDALIALAYSSVGSAHELRAAIEQYGREQYARLTDLNSELTDKANQYLIENARLDRELAAANAEKKALQEDLASEKKWGELWYFVSDEEPLAFETIVSQYAPKRWIDQAYKLMAARALRKGTT